MSLVVSCKKMADSTEAFVPKEASATWIMPGSSEVELELKNDLQTGVPERKLLVTHLLDNAVALRAVFHLSVNQDAKPS